MADLTERHEVRIRGRDHTIVFTAEDGRLIIRQEPEGGKSNEVCALTLSDPDELRAFFKGLRKILASLDYRVDEDSGVGVAPQRSGRLDRDTGREEDREALITQARQRNAQAFTPWTREEEQDVRRRHEAGESIQSIARKHNRSPRAIELRLQRMGVLPSPA